MKRNTEDGIDEAGWDRAMARVSPPARKRSRSATSTLPLVLSPELAANAERLRARVWVAPGAAALGQCLTVAGVLAAAADYVASRK